MCIEASMHILPVDAVRFGSHPVQDRACYGDLDFIGIGWVVVLATCHSNASTTTARQKFRELVHAQIVYFRTRFCFP